MSAGLPVPGAEPIADGRTGANEGGTAHDGTAAIRDELARRIGRAGLTPFEIEDWRLDEVAEGLAKAGFRRLVEDDDTIERVMWACAAVDDYLPGEMSDAGIAYYTAVARAAVRALRKDAR